MKHNVFQVSIYYEDKVERYSFKEDEEIIIGRDDNCDIVVKAKGVSRKHCKIKYDNEQIYLEDLNSTNGTFIGDEKIQKSYIGLSQPVRIGCVLFVIEELLSSDKAGIERKSERQKIYSPEFTTTTKVDIMQEELSIEVYKKLAEEFNKKQLELLELNFQLKNNIAQLHKTQAMLIQQEKMASLGILVAGIAHEFNNPISAILSSVQNMEQLLNELLLAEAEIRNLELNEKQVKIYLKLKETILNTKKDYILSSENVEEKEKKYKEIIKVQKMEPIEEVQVLLNSYIDLEDLIELLKVFNCKPDEKVIGGLECLNILILKINIIKRAAERVIKLVEALKGYSHLDRSHWSPVNIIKGLEETLIILQNKLKYGIKVEKEFGEISNVMGNAGELNQVWTNLLVNSIDAIGEQGMIRMRANQEGERIIIEIEDNGCGIPKLNLPRVFDPFFTTKEPGKGTGLGLYICKEIVEKHKGKIRITSEPGKTIVRIELPAIKKGI